MAPSVLNALALALFSTLPFANAGLHLHHHPPRSTICDLLDSKLPGRISYPGNSVYTSSLNTYYADQERVLIPHCIFSPTNTWEVSRFVRLIVSNGSPQFAIRAGGHMLFGGAANIDKGVTVDLRAMNDWSLSDDNQVVSVGGGTIWSDIYPHLDAHNVTIVGARVPGIAVGGFATGGGINFQARRHGWACDNIVGYEVVLGDGRVTYASASRNRDLWLALKGGSNNFGIITRFDIATRPQGLMWGGVIAFNYTQATLDAQAKSFASYMEAANFDDAADMGIILGFVGGQFVIENSLFYLDPTPYPKTYQGFTSIPSTFNTLKISNVSQVVIDFGQALPTTVPRVTELVYSFKSGDASLYSSLFSSWQSGATPLAKIPGLQLQFLIQPQPVSNGTNSLGVTPNARDLVIAVVTAAYNNAADDATVFSTMQSIVAQHEKLLDSKGLSIPFKYLNYADPTQDPISSYGSEMVAQLKRTSRKYDPRGVFQNTVPGGFKLPK